MNQTWQCFHSWHLDLVQSMALSPFISQVIKNILVSILNKHKIISRYLNFIYWYIWGELSVVHTCICVCMHVHVHVLCVDKRPMPRVFLCCSPPQFLKQSLSDPGANRGLFTWEFGRPNLRPILVQQWAISLLGHLHSSKDFKEASRKKRYGYLAHCTFFHAHVCLCSKSSPHLEGKLLVSYLSPLSKVMFLHVVEDTQNAFLRWFFLVAKERNCKDTDLEFSAVILSSKERIAWEKKLTGKDYKNLTKFRGPGLSCFQDHLHLFSSHSLVSLPPVLIWVRILLPETKMDWVTQGFP